MDDHRWLSAWGMGAISVGAASLLVPLYVVQFGGNSFEIGLLGAAAAFIGAPGGILGGRLADRTSNPRSIILFTLVGVGVVLGAMPLFTSISVLILANVLLWFAFAVASPVSTLLVIADVPKHEWDREIALLNKYQGYGWAGGLMLGIGWSAIAGRLFSAAATKRSLFVVCGGTAIVAAVLLTKWMPDPSERQIGRVDPKRIADALSTGRRNVREATFLFNPNRLYWSTRSAFSRQFTARFTTTLAVYFLAVVLFFTGFSAFFAPLPLYLTRVGFPSNAVFGLYLVSSLGAAAAYVGAGSLSSTFSPQLLQAGALGVRALAIWLVAVVGTAFAADATGMVVSGVLFTIIGVSWAVITVTASSIVTRNAPAEIRGQVLGLYAALSALAGGVGSLVGGALATTFGFTVTFGVASVVILASAGIVVTLRGISA